MCENMWNRESIVLSKVKEMEGKSGESSVEEDCGVHI